jgi:hypothetical protein
VRSAKPVQQTGAWLFSILVNLHNLACIGKSKKRIAVLRLRWHFVVTLVYFTILILMMLLMAMFDSIIFDRMFFQSVLEIYPFEFGTRRTIVTAGAIVGLLIAIYTDYKLKKEKKQPQSINKRG